jgi:hypothetical protein
MTTLTEKALWLVLCLVVNLREQISIWRRERRSASKNAARLEKNFPNFATGESSGENTVTVDKFHGARFRDRSVRPLETNKKEKCELGYWKSRKKAEKKLGNSHYEGSLNACYQVLVNN